MANGGVVVVISGQDDTQKVFDAIERNLKHTTEAAHETEGALSQLGERAKRYLEYAGIAFGVRETIDSFKEVIAKSLEFGETLSNMSRNTGLSVETLSTLHYAAGVTGQDFDGASASVSKLSAALGEAASGSNKKADALLRSLGLNAKELATQADGTEVAFKKVTQAIAGTAAPAQQALYARELLGRSGQREISMLSQIGTRWDDWKAKAQAAGVFMTTEHAKALEETNAKLNAMKESILGASIAFTDGFTPSLNRMLDVLAGGKSHLELFKSWGDYMARTLATLAEGALVTASAFEYLWAGPSDLLNKHRQEELANARELYAFANKMYAEVSGEHKASPVPGEPTPKGPAHIPDLSGGEDKLDAARKARDAAQLRLDEQMAQLRAQIAKAAQEQQLAQLEADHARNLVSDQEFYAQKLAIEKAGLDAQRQAARDKQADIDKKIGKLETDEKKHRGGNSEEQAKVVEDQSKILDLRTKRLALDGEIAKINADGAKAEIDAAQKLYELSVKQTEQVNELAAKREAITGGSVEERLHQSADTYDIKREALVADYGEGSKPVSDADFAFGNEQSQIRAKGAEEKSGVATADIGARRAKIDDRQARGTITTVDAQRERITLDQQEAQALTPVLAAYEELANSGDLQATQKVIELKTRIGELKDPVDEVSAHIRDSFDGAFESLFENLDQGMKDLESFTKAIQRTLEQATYKKFIEPLIQGELDKLYPNKVPGAGGGTAKVVDTAASVAVPALDKVLAPDRGGTTTDATAKAAPDNRWTFAIPDLDKIFAAGEPATGPGPVYGDPGIGGVHAIPANVNPGLDIGGAAVKAAAGIGSALGIPGLGGKGKNGGGGITITLLNEGGLPLKIGDTKTSGDIDKDQVLSIIKDDFDAGGLMRTLLAGFHV